MKCWSSSMPGSAVIRASQKLYAPAFSFGVLMQVRSAVQSDSAAIAELLVSLGYPGTELFMDEKIRQLLSHPDASLFVAVEGASVLGFVSLHFIPQIALEGDFCRISYFCVFRDGKKPRRWCNVGGRDYSSGAASPM
jgi:hypothetical protein